MSSMRDTNSLSTGFVFDTWVLAAKNSSKYKDATLIIFSYTRMKVQVHSCFCLYSVDLESAAVAYGAPMNFVE